MKFGFFILLCLFELVADVFAKEHVETRRSLYALAAVLGYLFGNVAWIISMRNGMLLSVGAVLFSIIVAVGAVVIGVGVYHEPVTRVQLVGLALGAAAIALLAIGRG